MAKQSWTAGRHRSKKHEVDGRLVRQRVDFRLQLSALYLDYNRDVLRNILGTQLKPKCQV